jgi:hypothetical protein
MARRLRVREVKSMSLSFYHVHSRACDVRSIGFLAVKGCVKFFGAVFRGVFAWEKSMLSALGFLIVVRHPIRRYLFGVVDGGFFFD